MRAFGSFVCLLLLASSGIAAPPDDLDPRIELAQAGVKLTLVAEHPSIMTPTGIDVDERGRLWAVASHTHFRPEDYNGPAHDQVLIFEGDSDRKSFTLTGRKIEFVEIESQGGTRHPHFTLSFRFVGHTAITELSQFVYQERAVYILTGIEQRGVRIDFGWNTPAATGKPFFNFQRQEPTVGQQRDE